mmetsp:Transcript_129328/g.326543  ORF Transcript_129328/g.326543 Transcript_129328/m.326543 type:complete len:261 (+) Transcript_129328:159-941(+)
MTSEGNVATDDAPQCCCRVSVEPRRTSQLSAATDLDAQHRRPQTVGAAIAARAYPLLYSGIGGSAGWLPLLCKAVPIPTQKPSCLRLEIGKEILAWKQGPTALVWLREEVAQLHRVRRAERPARLLRIEDVHVPRPSERRAPQRGAPGEGEVAGELHELRLLLTIEAATISRCCVGVQAQQTAPRAFLYLWRRFPVASQPLRQKRFQHVFRRDGKGEDSPLVRGGSDQQRNLFIGNRTPSRADGLVDAGRQHLAVVACKV